MTITGTGFSTDPAQNIVRFGPNRAPVLSATATTLIVQVPNGQPLSRTNVTVALAELTQGQTTTSATSNSVSFTTSAREKVPKDPSPGGTDTPPEPGPTGNPTPPNHPSPTPTPSPTPPNVYREYGRSYQNETLLTIPTRCSCSNCSCSAPANPSLQLYYQSQQSAQPSSTVGNGWDHNYFERLIISASGSVIHNNGVGRNDSYSKNNQGNFVSPPQFFTDLKQNPNGTFTLRSPDGDSKTFDTDGKLLETRDRNDNFMTLHYNNLRQLIRINDVLGRDIIYRYIVGGINDGRLQEIEDFIGRKVKFTYNSLGDLVEVTSPAVVGTPNGNDFPQGKTTRYTYSSGFSDERLNHNLLTVTRPNEVANGGPPSLIFEYGTTPGSFEFDKVIRQTYGGTNASGISAGGTYNYSYTQLNMGVQSDDPNLSASRTRETDRNGNVKEYEYNRLGLLLVRREFTRGIRSTDPSVYETRMTYNADGRLLRVTNPEGNSVQYAYDEGNANRFQQGNLLSETRIPDANRGGDQARLTTSYTYEARFNQVKSVSDPRGNDPNFVPPNGGSNSPVRYTTVYTFDYEVIGDPLLNPGGFQRGNVVRKQEPTVLLPDGSLQPIITEYIYNQFGQLTSEIDPEGNVDDYFYFPENDPDGDGNTSPGTRPGLNTSTGGYLKEKITDNRTSARRTETTPPAQISDKYFYDPVGNTIRTIDGRGNDTLYSFNQLNQVVRQQSELPFRYITDIFYDFNDNVVRTDIENRVASVQDGKPVFTGNGNFDTQPGTPAFFVHRYTYDILDNVVQKDEDATGSSPSRLITGYRYDSNENRTREILPEGNVFATVYDERDLIFTRTRGFGSPQASTSTYSYDLNRNLALLLDGEDNNGDGRNDETTYQYDGFDRRIRIIDAVGNRIIGNYDPNGNIVKSSKFGRIGGPSPTNNSGAGNVLLSQREFNHDELNRVFQRDDLLFTSSGVVTVRPPVLTEGPLTPGDGKISLGTIYDRNSRNVREIQDDLDTTLMEYDGVDRLTRITDPEGNITLNSYDGNSNLTQKVETERSQKAGVATEMFTTTNQYDALDRLTLASDSCQNTNRYAYDSRNNLTHQTDAKVDGIVGCPRFTNAQGNSVRSVYDGMNRKLQTIQDLRVGGVGSSAIDTSNLFNVDARITIISTYDGNGRLASLTDDNGNATSYSYDSLNRLAVETFADGTTREYTYDRDDNVVRYKDNSGTIQTFLYDAITRRVRCDITRASGVIGTTLNQYEFDGLSRMTRVSDNNDPQSPADDSNVTYAYDSLSRLIEELQNGKAISGDWFAGDQRVGLTYSNDRKIALTFDNLDRLKTINDVGAATNIVRYDYIGPNRVLQRQHQNGTRLTFLNNAGTTDTGYDPVKRPIEHRHLRSDNSLIVGFTHAYDREDNKLNEKKLHSLGNSELYRYDSVYRIDDFKRGQLNAGGDAIVGPPQKTQAWSLDGMGNWRRNTTDGVIENRMPNEMNEYVTVGSTSQFHDENGNLTNDGSRGYRWDYKNRLRQVCLLDPNNRNGADGIPGTGDDCQAPSAVQIVTYAYDATSRRIRKVVTNSGTLNGTTDFFYDGWRVLEERNGANVVTQQYVYGIYLDELLVLDRNLNANGSAIGFGDQRLFYHPNTQYSVHALTDAAGLVVEAYQYDAYGRATVFISPGSDGVWFTNDDSQAVSSAVNNPYTYTGQRLDSETLLMYFKARYFETSLGRFISRDPIGYVGGINLYAAYFAPNFWDPLGLTKDNDRGPVCGDPVQCKGKCFKQRRLAHMGGGYDAFPDPEDPCVEPCKCKIFVKVENGKQEWKAFCVEVDANGKGLGPGEEWREDPPKGPPLQPVPPWVPDPWKWDRDRPLVPESPRPNPRPQVPRPGGEAPNPPFPRPDNSSPMA